MRKSTEKQGICGVSVKVFEEITYCLHVGMTKSIISRTATLDEAVNSHHRFCCSKFCPSPASRRIPFIECSCRKICISIHPSPLLLKQRLYCTFNCQSSFPHSFVYSQLSLTFSFQLDEKFSAQKASFMTERFFFLFSTLPFSFPPHHC